MDSPSPEELENFLIYGMSVTTNMAQSPHKVTATTTDMLTKMTTSLSQILYSPAKTDPVRAVESLLSNEWWKDLKNSLHAAWTLIDNM
jgi:hypothetical protein